MVTASGLLGQMAKAIDHFRAVTVISQSLKAEGDGGFTIHFNVIDENAFARRHVAQPLQRREALRIAAGFRSDEAFDNGTSDEEMLETVLPWLPPRQTMELAAEAIRIYVWDRIGSEN